MNINSIISRRCNTAYLALHSRNRLVRANTLLLPVSDYSGLVNNMKFNAGQSIRSFAILASVLFAILAVQSPAAANNSGNCEALDLGNYDNGGALEQAINSTSCSELRVTGTFTWGKWNNFARIEKPNLTISGSSTAQINGVQFIVQASNVTIQGIRFNPNDTNVAGVIVGCPADFGNSCNASLSVNNTKIRRNLFTGYKATVPVLVAASTNTRHVNTHIVENAFGGFKGVGELNKAIQIGASFDNDWRGIAANGKNNTNANAHPSPIPRNANGVDIQDDLSNGLEGEWVIPWGTIIRSNVISTPIKLGTRGASDDPTTSANEGVGAKQAVSNHR